MACRIAGDGLWSIYFYDVLLTRLDERVYQAERLTVTHVPGLKCYRCSRLLHGAGMVAQSFPQNPPNSLF